VTALFWSMCIYRQTQIHKGYILGLWATISFYKMQEKSFYMEKDI